MVTISRLNETRLVLRHVANMDSQDAMIITKMFGKRAQSAPVNAVIVDEALPMIISSWNWPICFPGHKFMHVHERPCVGPPLPQVMLLAFIIKRYICVDSHKTIKPWPVGEPIQELWWIRVDGSQTHAYPLVPRPCHLHPIRRKDVGLWSRTDLLSCFKNDNFMIYDNFIMFLVLSWSWSILL